MFGVGVTLTANAKLTFAPRLILRTYQVLSKPSEELISLLGLEVPIPPALSLAGIRADGVVLNWKAPDQQKITTVKHYIHINGVNGLSTYSLLGVHCWSAY